MRKPRLCKGRLAAAVLLASCGAGAQEMIPIQQLPEANLIGLGVFGVPDFYGSDKNEARAVPIVRYQLPGSRMYFRLIGPEASFNLVERDDIEAGPLIRWRKRRDDDVDDAVVKRMRPVATATEVGAFATYRMPVDGRPLHRVVFYADVVANPNNVYGGVSGNLRVNYVYPFEQGLMGKPLVGNVGLGLFWANSSFNRAYFGVSGSDLALFPELGGREYRPDGGATSLKIPFSLSSQVDPRWLLTLAGRYERLLGDAKDSPLVDRRGNENQWVIGIAASYLF